MSLLLRSIVLLLLFDFLHAAPARKVKRKENYHFNVPPPPPQQPPAGPTAHAAQPYEYETINHDEFPTHPHITAPGGTFLTDNGLRNIGKGSADPAGSSAAGHNAAGHQAAYVAFVSQAAAQAADTAVSVLLKGKEVLLRRLEEQIEESHKAMAGELAQLQLAKRSAKTAQYAAQQAINHVSVLTAALHNAQAASELAQKAAAEAAAELSSQIDMVAQAKAKLEQVETQHYGARLDYDETKEAAEKAQEAYNNANEAAAHANVQTVYNVHEKSDRNVGSGATQHLQSVNHNYGSQ